MADSPQLRAVFMGSPDFAVPSLHAVARRCELRAVVSQPDRPAGRGRKLRPPAVKVAAEALGVPVLQPTKVRKGRLRALLEPFEPELIVVTAYGRILGADVLELPTHGCVNVHASLLPRWRGAAPIQRAVLAGDAQTGVAIMRMDLGCDTGPVYRMRATPIGPEETSGELFERLAVLGGEVLDEFLTEFPEVPPPRDQAELDGEPVHAAKLDKAEGEVDWSRAATEVIDHVRGMDPWPAAYSTRAGARLKLFAAANSERARPPEAAAGTVLGVDAQGLHVCCRDAVVCMGQLQGPGKRRMSARDYAAGHPFADAERLGT
ncbi:Methionyl-tRNA formyltransferase [Enhygromyxa salina]|uniref:Methionyl-tRNA formyltransferase n=1 Tax=Enhygromyxa salina TaxID=215803 RepID=A0A2S9XE14_9BACT|nr:methionyl-tRNA formyltransferase [Enhygromyxa salina]PRP90931.1 Methionyl-tRNA formyltransferase [Enhygromyxa salina]